MTEAPKCEKCKRVAMIKPCKKCKLLEIRAKREKLMIEAMDNLNLKTKEPVNIKLKGYW